MTNRNRSVILILLLFFIIHNFASVLAATKCYQCSTTTKSHCDDLADTSELDQCKTTTGDEIKCLMYKYRLNGKTITYRGCRVRTDTCNDVHTSLEQEGKIMTDCRLCDTDLCSGRGSALVNLPAIAFTISFVLLVKLMT